VLGRDADTVTAVQLNGSGGELARSRHTAAELPALAAARNARWVWSDTALWYPPLLAAGVRVERCHDLRLCHAILAGSARVDGKALRTHPGWAAGEPAALATGAPALFELGDDAGRSGPPTDVEAALAEFARQRAVLATATEPARMRLLLAAESAGALIAAELTAAGVPWDAQAHEAILHAALGARPATGGLPARLQAADAQVRAALGDESARLDSQPRLLRSLHRAGVQAESTSRWELARYEHPVIEPLLEYKRLSRLHTANGWAWLSHWVADGRFRPVYLPAGVVTGRWASSGGGALQIPRSLRAAVRADPGWLLVRADAAQLEPRVLAAMSHDTALAAAARGRDLYQGIVDSGAVPTRADAKVAILGAMYGATTGDSGRLVPLLRRVYPRAMALVDEAARTGEQGGVVTTWLGRSCPPAPESWLDIRRRGALVEASAAEQARARRSAGDRGRFTRNFVVQGTAAEWALCWLAVLRGMLGELDPVDEADSAPRSGGWTARRPHLALFLHDEVIVHVPAPHADAVAEALRTAAQAAGRLLFGEFPLDFPLEVTVGDTASKR